MKAINAKSSTPSLVYEAFTAQQTLDKLQAVAGVASRSDLKTAAQAARKLTAAIEADTTATPFAKQTYLIVASDLKLWARDHCIDGFAARLEALDTLAEAAEQDPRLTPQVKHEIDALRPWVAEVSSKHPQVWQETEKIWNRVETAASALPEGKGELPPLSKYRDLALEVEHGLEQVRDMPPALRTSKAGQKLVLQVMKQQGVYGRAYYDLPPVLRTSLPDPLTPVSLPALKQLAKILRSKGAKQGTKTAMMRAGYEAGYWCLPPQERAELTAPSDLKQADR